MCSMLSMYVHEQMYMVSYDASYNGIVYMAIKTYFYMCKCTYSISHAPTSAFMMISLGCSYTCHNNNIPLN